MELQLQINQQLLQVMEIRPPHHQVQVKHTILQNNTSADHNLPGGESKVSQTSKPDGSTKAKPSGYVCYSCVIVYS